jgi:transcriptional coactivator HFI1/ADA1
MLPICFETGLASGHSPDAAQFMSVATETFIKQFLSSVFDKTRCNGPGAGGSAGSGGGANWVMTHKYRVQLEKEEDAWSRGELKRDKSGLLPIEAKAASERGSLGMADLSTALEIGDCGLGQMLAVVEQVLFGYREGELENWDEYSMLPGHENKSSYEDQEDTIMTGVLIYKSKLNGVNGANAVNGINGHTEPHEAEGWGWEGTASQDQDSLNSLLDSCLAIGS